MEARSKKNAVAFLPEEGRRRPFLRGDRRGWTKRNLARLLVGVMPGCLSLSTAKPQRETVSPGTLSPEEIKKVEEAIEYKLRAVSIFSEADFSREDLINDAWVTVLSHCRYDPSRRGSVLYLQKLINGSINDSFRKYLGKKRGTQLYARYQRLLANLGRAELSVEEVAEHFGVSEYYASQALANADNSPADKLSLDWECYDDDDDPVNLYDIIADEKSLNPEAAAIKNEVRQWLGEHLGKLDPLKREVLIRSLFKEETLKGIGLDHNLSESRISQIEAEAKRWLRDRLAPSYYRFLD